MPFELEELAKRRLAAVLVEMYRQKGTAIGIENAIRFFLGIDITAITVDYLKPAQTHFVDLIEPSAPVEYDHWVIGVSELGMATWLH